MVFDNYPSGERITTLATATATTSPHHTTMVFENYPGSVSSTTTTPPTYTIL
jgi:hypothetical protein